MSETIRTQVLVLGAGPGGYSAAFRAADLGLSVVLVEKEATLGGVCLNVGCIPSKALLHVAKVIDEAHVMAQHGVSFGAPKIEIDKVREYKNGVIKKLTTGLAGLAKKRNVQVVTGMGEFTGSHQVSVQLVSGEKQTIEFESAIIAAGSQPVRLPFVPQDPRIFDSTGALELQHTKGRMLVIGGGIIGLEMATVYHALGMKMNVVELGPMVIPGADTDIVNPLFKRISKQYESILLNTKVTAVEAKKDGVWVTFAGESAPKQPEKFDSVLVAVGRKPNGSLVAADKAGVTVNDRGFIPVDQQMRTNVPHIFAIGDVAGDPMLAHKAVHEGHLAAEVIAGKKHYFDGRLIPSVAYTDPEVAWVGVTEQIAKQKGLNVKIGKFPWAASGRALSMGGHTAEGLTKLIFDEHERVIGGAVVGPQAGELVAEIGLAIEMGADAEDIALTIHAHPTLSETVGLAAGVFLGVATDIYAPRKIDG